MKYMEIYRNSEAQVTIPSPTVAGGTHVITVTSPDGSTSTPSFTLNTTNGTVTFLLDFKHTLYDGRVKIEDTITRPAPTVEDPSATESFVVTEYIDVVTPLFTWHDLDETYPSPKVPELESLVRQVVEAFTGTHFGKSIEQHVLSTGINKYYFDAPIIEFTGISDRYMTNTTTLNPPKLSYEFLEGNRGLWIDWSSDLYDPKTDSLWVLGKRVPTAPVLMEGVFGYDRVPQDVKQAAVLIAGMWGCKQAVWRDRFIQTMRSSDWSFQYDDGAFGRSTGSVTADNLLAKYANRGMSPEVI